ncbi:hypothetical protein PX554_12820 [Sphingomonas sp. H39-1-10]|uniref:hypothetical protein n=1 Tax=Sphingomonas pollutisoli TaxID=3030829 RepID=UPI0023B96813|nr:hypothetical protein [Sphingomonas pollutisoli]MDF0489019.1 hypothetical protein [Sphingomonas pollutisoli]
MDAASIISAFEAKPGAMAAELHCGPVVNPITIHKVTAHGIVFSGKGVPPLNEPVSVVVGKLEASGIISARTERRCALLFLRPSAPC